MATTITELKTVDEIVERYKGQKTAVIGILQEIQSQYNYLPQEALRRVSDKLTMSLSQVYSIATFYKAFSLKPRGKHLIIVCMGTACHVRGASKLADELQRILNIKPGETTEDGRFTLEFVNCLGACGLGPLMVIDGEYFGDMHVNKIEPVLTKYKK